MKDEQRKESFGTTKPVSEGHIRTARGKSYIHTIVAIVICANVSRHLVLPTGLLLA